MCLIRVRPEIEEDVPVARARNRSRQTMRSRPTSTVVIAPPPPPPPPPVDYGTPSQIITAYPNSNADRYAPSIIDATPPMVTLSPTGAGPHESVTIVNAGPGGGYGGRMHRRYSSSRSSTTSSDSSCKHTVCSPKQSVISTRSKEYHGGSFYPHAGHSSHLSVGYEGDKGGRRRANTVNGYAGRRSLNVVNGSAAGGQYGRSSHRSVRSYGGEADFRRRSREERIVVVDEFGRRVEY